LRRGLFARSGGKPSPSSRAASANNGQLSGGWRFLPLLLRIALGDAAGQPLVDLFFEIGGSILAQWNGAWEAASLLQTPNVLASKWDVFFGFELGKSKESHLLVAPLRASELPLDARSGACLARVIQYN
jgi:hypothetical protein